MRDMWTGRRSEWLCAQWIAGVANAYFMIDNAVDGYTFAACMSCFMMFVAAGWRLPPPTKKDRR